MSSAEFDFWLYKRMRRFELNFNLPLRLRLRNKIAISKLSDKRVRHLQKILVTHGRRTYESLHVISLYFTI
jgi:hypothetical protein